MPRVARQRLAVRWHRFRWLVIGWIVVFWRLGYPSLLDPDEAHYAELTREMLHSGSWLVPLLDGKPFIDKPVLFHWLQGASVLLLGETEFAARLPSALAALALIAITRWVGVSLFSVATGEWGAIMFATIPATFALSSVALFDMVFATFLFGAVGCLLVAGRDRRGGIEACGYALLTLAVMTKGPVAVVLVVLLLAAGWLAGGAPRAQLRGLHWRAGLTAVVIGASPWFLWMNHRFGAAFVDGYLLAGNLWYFTQPAVFSRRAISHAFYARAFAGAFFPWSAVVIGRGVDVVRGWRAGVTLQAEEALLWLWVLVVLGFFSLARFKLDHYIFPAAPACCLIAAHAWRTAAAEPGPASRGTRASVLAIAGALVAGGSFGGVYLFELDLELPRAAVLLPLAMLAGGCALLIRSGLRNWTVPRTAAIPAVMLLAVYAVVVAVGFPVLERMRPTAIVARQLARTAPPSAPVALYRLERWRSSLRYYLDRPVHRLDDPDALRAFITQPQPVYVVMLRREFDDARREMPVYLLMQHRAVVGTTGRGLRRQKWGFLVVATNVPPRRPRPSSPVSDLPARQR